MLIYSEVVCLKQTNHIPKDHRQLNLYRYFSQFPYESNYPEKHY